MTRVARDPSTPNGFIVETDWDMNQDLSDQGYKAWLAEKKLTDVEGNSLFQRYIGDAMQKHYEGKEPIQWLISQGIAWRDARALRDARDHLGNFTGFAIVVGSDFGADRFEAEWLR